MTNERQGAIHSSLKHSIIRRLLIVVFSAYLIITLVMTAAHMIIEYQDAKSNIWQDLEKFEHLLQAGLSEALFEKNQEEIKKILNNSTLSSIVIGAKLESDDWTSEIWEIKEPTIEEQNKFMSHSFELTYEDRNKQLHSVGRVTIYSNNQVVFNQVKVGFYLLIVNAIVKTICLWAFFLWAGYVYISRPLAVLTQATREISSGHLESGKVNMPKSRGDKTEIDFLAEAFNSMVDKVHHAQHRLVNIIDSMPSILIGITDTGRITDWNARAEQETGIPASEAIGQSIEETYPTFTKYRFGVQKALLTGTIQKSSKKSEIINDELRYFDIVTYPIKSEPYKGAVIRIDDITSQVQLQDMMAQTEKMSSVGGLAAGVAHEINNPLGAIIQGGQNIVRRLDPNLKANVEAAELIGVNVEQIRAYMEERRILSFLTGIRESGERASNIVQNLLQFTRRSNTKKTYADFEQIIDRALELARTDYDLKKKIDFKHVTVIKNIQPELPQIYCCTMEIEQVLLNLFKNSAHAMNQAEGEAKLIINLSTENQKLLLEIEDNGCGMPESLRKRIFEPFFTTKGVGEGTGLGLSVSYSIIVENHNGALLVESTEGIGTKFIISLPVVESTSICSSET